MAETAQVALLPAAEVARQAPPHRAPNGIRFSAFADTGQPIADLERLIQAIPASVAAGLNASIFFFVPLAMAEQNPDTIAAGHRTRPDDTMIAPGYTPELADAAICHRSVQLGPDDATFISTRLLPDRFSLAFELFINAAHAFVDHAGVPAPFSELVWRQALADVRGETSHDAWDHRAAALAPPAPAGTVPAPGPRIDERSKSAYFAAAFSDAIAIYLLSLAIDFDYSELREREYPLLAPQALAERLRHMHTLVPPNPGYEFAIRYRRRA